LKLLTGKISVSPGDPAFFLHHATIDRLWTLCNLPQNAAPWISTNMFAGQGLDPETRQYALNGTNTMDNQPPSEETSLDFVMNVGFSGGTNVTVRENMSTTKGSFCYMYL
jgi:tyrosinase